MSQPASSIIRSTFENAATAFVELVRQIEPEAWPEPGLGVWNVRDLVGHTSRSLSTIENYLGKATDSTRLDDPVDYFRLARELSLADEEAVAQRGRDAGAALGDDPTASVSALAARVTALVAASPDDTPVGTPVGTMALIDYLPTRVFELTVHSLDLSRALGLDYPAGLQPGIGASCELVGRLAAESPAATSVLMSLTGRAELAPGFTLL